MLYRRLHDIFVMLIFVATGKLHRYRFSYFFFILSLTCEKRTQTNHSYGHLHVTNSPIRDSRETDHNACNLHVYIADTYTVNTLILFRRSNAKKRRNEKRREKTWWAIFGPMMFVSLTEFPLYSGCWQVNGISTWFKILYVIYTEFSMLISSVAFRLELSFVLCYVL